MVESARTIHNAQKPLELHPVLRTGIDAVIARFETLGIRPRIQDAAAAAEAQDLTTAQAKVGKRPR